MEWRLIYATENGCKIVIPGPKYQQPKESDSDAIARLWAQSIPNVTEFIACKPQQLPTDLTFRDAWEKGDLNEPIRINLAKAICIHRERLQRAALCKIDQLSDELELALEAQDTPKCVSIRKTKSILRTIHEMNLSHCKTVDELKKSIPKELEDVWNFYPLS